MPTIPKMTELALAGKRVMIREDFNVPVEDGRVSGDQRLRAALPTVQSALAANARVMLLSHLGRPQEGVFDPRYSLAPVALRLSELLEREVPLAANWIDGVEVEPGQAVLCENVRFLPGEKADDPELARRMAALCDIFVMDAFGTAHRAQASTHGVIRYAPAACAGPLLAAELEALGRALEAPARPMVAVVGGAKVSGKLDLLESIARRVDRLIVGGGIANTFLAAAGYAIGRSLHEPALVDTARRLLDVTEIPLPVDVCTAPELSVAAPATVRAVEEVGADELILDIGPRTAASLARLLADAGTIVWNGPLGVFEYDAFAGGTRALACAVAASKAFSIAGGGDTLAAIDKFGVAGGISYISTGGGAFLEFLEGKTLPALAILAQRHAHA